MNQTYSKLSNGFILPKGKVTPNTLFVGGIDMMVNENEIRDFFAKFGTVREAKIIKDRGGICRGYGFVYFNKEVNIESIVEQQISFKGRKLKLGPAILKERRPRPIVSHLVGPTTWTSPSGYVYCPCCSPVGGGMTQPSPIPSGRTHYNQPYSYNNFGEVVFPLMSTNYSHGPYYQPLTMQYTTAPWTPDRPTQLFNQSFVDCGVQTVL
ncbi:deleted in azoospermia-like [Nothobranchius furzeri]|uniref:Deleted in azoospermia-like n=1 Tax=Nothobranchius furzeri TaxID=105023 RepID=A0A8C6NMI5_NOTFU|nr:deleted in azoospermia-like [Nothobranchius furzeri]XP_015811400.1 deleted in azoospermia-like [Nothobranchius furzeri]KAF7221727.1 transcript variant X1 [Nothobranchius furzeri]KAF7221728.1 transcript variant X2 [Nothobranchius furzeri]